MRLTRWAQEDAAVRVWGETDVLEVSAPLPGVLRVRLAPEARAGTLSFPRLASKRSFAVRPGPTGGEALEVDEQGELLRVTGGGLTLHLDRRSGAWRVTGDGTDTELARVLGSAGRGPHRPARAGRRAL